MDKHGKPSRRRGGPRRIPAAADAIGPLSAEDSIARALHASDHPIHPPAPEILAARSNAAGEAFHPEDISRLALQAAADHADSPAEGRRPLLSEPTPVGEHALAASEMASQPHGLGTQAGRAGVADATAGLVALQASMLDFYRQAAFSGVSFWTSVLFPYGPKVRGRPTPER